MSISICGDVPGPFWDLNVTWYNERPEFTPCFKHTALLWAPTVIFLLLLPIDLRRFIGRRSYGRPSFGFVCYLQLVFIVLTAIFTWIITFLALIKWLNGGMTWFWWGFASYFLMSVTMTGAAVLSICEKRIGLTGSAVVWLTLFVSVLCSCCEFFSLIARKTVLDDPFSSLDAFRALFSVYWLLVSISLIAHSLSSVSVPSTVEETGQVPWPEEYKSFPSRFSFTWVISLIWRGYHREIDLKEIWALHTNEKSATVLSYFEKSLRDEFADTVESKNKKTSGSPDAVLFRARPPSIMKVFMKSFGWSLVWAGSLEFCQVLLVFVEPTVVGLLTGFASSLGSEPTWHGYIFASLLVVSLMLRSILEQCAWFRMMRLGARINSAMIGCIYRKAFKLTSEARSSSTVGEIVNLMSVDSGRFFDFSLDIHVLWSAPLQLAIGFYIAYQQVGHAVWAGLGVVVLIFIINGFVSRIYEKYQEEQMELKDERVKLFTEVLNGMKVIKLYGWEPAFQKRVEDIRQRELQRMRIGSYIGAFFEVTWHSTTLLSSIACLTAYILLNSTVSLNAQIVFVTLSVFRVLVVPLSLLPSALTEMIMLRVSIKRLRDYFSGQEIDESQIQPGLTDDIAVFMEKASFAWNSTVGTPILHDFSITIPKGKLVAVVGKVGSGKSSFINALCGEMHKTDGSVFVNGNIAYVSQQAWIQNMTVKDNILFGKPLNEIRYNRTVNACSLLTDFEALPAGDMTEIGERGINLSGGQKQRINLARAVYQDRDLYLLDDPLSAVDVHVGKHMFQHVIGTNGMLKDKTRILVTHALTYLPDCDVVVVIADGKIREIGTFKELVERRGAFADFIRQYLREASDEEIKVLSTEEYGEALDKIEDVKVELQQRLSHPQHSVEEGRTSKQCVEAVLHRLTSVTSDKSDILEKHIDQKRPGVQPQTVTEAGKLIDEELMQIGQVSWKVYYKYFKAAGSGLFLYALFVALSLTFEMLGNIWLQQWSDNSENFIQNKTQTLVPASTGLTYLGLCGLGQMSFTLLLGVAFAMFQIQAAKLIHSSLLTSILRAPMSFFDTTPAGRIVNRCGKDINVIDNEVPGSIDQFNHFTFALIYSVVGLFIYVPIFGVALVPSAVVYFFVQRLYVKSARRVRRLEAVTTSPIFSHFQETLQGVSTIRAFDQTTRFCDTSNRLVDTKFSTQLARVLFNRWVCIYLDMIGAFMVAATSYIIVYLVIHGEMTAGIVGLSLSSFALNLPGLLAWGAHVSSILEMELVSMERIDEYSNIESEAPWTLPRPAVPPSWPTQGHVVFDQFATRYRQGLPLVLSDFTADIQPTEKIGIVGRTGAGKSSLTLGLFRLVEAAQGAIIIDDVDISRIGLHELRRKLTIIPQDPVLFSGTLRMNVDPFDERADDELWLALEQSGLKDFVSTLQDGLQYSVAEGGNNLSVGQRQLVCLARALLRKSKILVLDEATAAVDVETDSFIQKTIREQFRDCTIITIAHRLNTILDSNRVMVLESGQLMECDSPDALASKEGSLFGNMLKEHNRSTL